MKKPALHARTYLGIEGGATRSSAIWMNDSGTIIKRLKGGPCNIRLAKDSDILQLWKQWRKEMSKTGESQPHAIGAFLAGCRTHSDKARIRRILSSVWPGAHFTVGNDTVSAIAAALGNDDGIILICGTGSIVRARKGNKTIQIGGWGHVGGDRGSAYWMGREFLRHIFLHQDQTGKPDALAKRVLGFLGLNKLEELVQWSLEAPKDEIASLTQIVFEFSRNKICRSIITEAVQLLTTDVQVAAKKIGFARPGKPFLVALSPGIVKYQLNFRHQLIRSIEKRMPLACVFFSETEGAVGAVMLARSLGGPVEINNEGQAHLARRTQESRSQAEIGSRGLSNALTEQRNPRTYNLDRQSIPQLIETMLDEERRTIPAIKNERNKIAKAITWIHDSLSKGGRLFYVGAGTSGRMGVLDASECPPTFGCDPEMVQGIIAGGRRALYEAVESAEDNANYGRQVIWDRGISKKDVVVGIAASGSTPFVLGALEAAHSIGCRVVLLTFNPAASFKIKGDRFLKIAVATGPEVITGSTRLKAGTATKLILNMFTTISMIKLGKVKSNLMIDLDPTCEKLHDRSARILSALKKITPDEAWKRLESYGWDLKKLLGR